MLAIKNRLANQWILLLALTFILAGCTPPGPRALLAGKRLTDRGRYKQAIVELKTATSLLPTNAQAWNYLGIACQHAGKFQEAAEAYQKALSLNRDLAEAHYNFGCLWLEQNNLDGARTELTAFTLRRGNSVQGWLKLGEAQLRSRDMNSAVKCFNEALHLSPRQPEALNGLGLVLVERGQAHQAAQYFAAAVQQQPDYAPALLNLAVIRQAYLNNAQGALKSYREYLAIKPRPANADAVEALVRDLEKANAAPTRTRPAGGAATQPPQIAAVNRHSEPSQSAEPAKSSPKMLPVASKSKLEPATSAKPATQPKSEIARLTTKPVVEPQSRSNHPDRSGQQVLQRSNPENFPPRESTTSSSEDLVTAAGVGPKTGQLATTAVSLPKLASESGLSGFPRYSYHSQIDVTPGDHAQAEHYFAKGAEDYRIGRYAAAAQAYSAAMRLDPGYFDACYNLGVAASAAGNLRQSLEAYEHALAINPDSVNARYNFALALQQANYPLDAAVQLEKILANHPREARAHLALANLYAQQFHDPGQAREHYLKALEYDPNNSQATAIRFWLTTHPR